MPLVVFLGIAVVSAVFWHRTVRSFALSTVLASLTTVVLFQVADYLEAGHMDSFAPIAMVTSSIPAVVLSVLVGLPIRARRRKGEIR